jgi:prepilin peptidase CpaA
VAVQALSPNTAYAFAALACAAVGAVSDVRTRRIPNRISGLGFLTGLLLHLMLGGWHSLLSAALAGLLGGGVFLLFGLAGGMGAGDVKLMAAVGALVGWQRWFGIFFVTAIVGGIMALILVMVRGRLKKTLWNVAFILDEMKHGRPAYVGKEELDVRSPRAVGLPHGAVIAVGTVFFLAICLRLSRG